MSSMPCRPAGRACAPAPVCALLLALAACAPRGGGDPQDRPVARVGDQVVTVRDFARMMQRRGGDVPGVFTNAAARRQLLDELVRGETLAVAARRGGYFDRPEVQQAARRQAIQLLEEDVRRQVAEPADADVAQRYAQAADRYSKPARIRFAVIRAARPAAADRLAAERARIGQARAEALAAAGAPDFGAVAAAYSDDQMTRYRGGDAGWLREEGEEPRFPAEVLAAARALAKPGDVSEVVDAPDALYLVKLIARQPREPLPLDLVRENIRITLRREREEQALEAKLKEKPADVWVDEALLAAVPVPPPPAGAARGGPPALPAGQFQN